MKKFINLTPHPVTLYVGDEIVKTYMPDGRTIRAVETAERIDIIYVDDFYEINLYKKTFGQAEVIYKSTVLPLTSLDLSGEYLYIISGLALNGIPDSLRQFFVCPSDPVRDDKGHVIGCRSFSR